MGKLRLRHYSRKVFMKGRLALDKEQLKKLLKENLTLSIQEKSEMYSNYYKVTVEFDDEVICEEYIDLPSNS